MAVRAETPLPVSMATSLEADRPSPYRWTICALLFVATTINYIDRQVLGVLAPTLQHALSWSESDYGDIVSWFSFAYGFGFLVAGQIVDWLGVRRGLSGAVIAWSLAAIGHAFARTVAGFSFARALLSEPPVVLLDEPTTGLDPQGARWFAQTVRQLRDSGRTILMSLHGESEVSTLATRAIRLDAGAVVADTRTGANFRSILAFANA